jgi:hypothetical protein
MSGASPSRQGYFGETNEIIPLNNRLGPNLGTLLYRRRIATTFYVSGLSM